MPTIPDKEPDRWSEGIDHHPRSVELMEFIAAMDFKHYNDYFCWKTGGDGDNGETLMYEMDAYFEQLAEEKTDKERTHDALRVLCSHRGTPIDEQSSSGEDIVLWADALMTRLEQERDEARRFGEDAATRYNELLEQPRVTKTRVTCVYCGWAYPEGTPTYGASALSDHIKTCPKHPLREAEETIAKLRAEMSTVQAKFEGTASAIPIIVANQHKNLKAQLSTMEQRHAYLAEQCAEKDAKAEQFRAEQDAQLKSLIQLIPSQYVVHVREGGGPEDLFATLALSLSKYSHD
jgi:hypothetical protein